MKKPEVPGTVEPGMPAPPSKAGVPAKALTLGTVGAGTSPDLPDSPAQAGSGKGLGAFIMVLIAAVLIGGGFWIGKATTDPTASDEYVALAAKTHETEQDREAAWSLNRTLDAKVASLTEGVELRESSVKDREDALKTSEAALKTQDEGIKKREAAVAGAEKKKADNTIGDGTWVVGVDIEPGVYKAAAPVSSTCYWGIYTSGSNGDDIIANDLPGGGLPSVTLAAGQDFKSSRCGTWAKQ